MVETPVYNNLRQEELADEIKNREAANARLVLMEQTIPKLHEDLKKVQEQLVQSRMEVRTPCIILVLLLSPPPALASLNTLQCVAKKSPHGQQTAG